MQEEAYLGRGEHVPQHLREHGEVVVVHPDQVAVLVDVLDSVREALVHRLILLRQKNITKHRLSGVSFRAKHAGGGAVTHHENVWF